MFRSEKTREMTAIERPTVEQLKLNCEGGIQRAIHYSVRNREQQTVVQPGCERGVCRVLIP